MIPESIAMIVTGLMALTIIVELFLIPQMDAYPAAKKFLLTPHSESNMVKDVYSVVPLPNVLTHVNGRNEVVAFSFIVKGVNQFSDITLVVAKTDTSDWKVRGYILGALKSPELGNTH